MKKLLLILNPTSGQQRAKRVFADMVEVYNRAGYDVTAFVTGQKGDATNIVIERHAEFDLIVCIGGDGTFNEVISGIDTAKSNTPIGYIPAGTTNDFATSLHLSKNLMNAARDIAVGTPRPLDIGRFNDKYFSYIASFGAFTHASYATPQNVKNALGHLAYLLAGIPEIPAIHGEHVKFTLDDGTVYEDDYIFGAISNCTSMAGVLTLDPKKVDMSDGHFELILIRKPRNPGELTACIHSLLTQNYDTPMLTFVSTNHVVVEAPEHVDWTLDGEKCPGQERFEAWNIYHAVQIVTNPNR